MLEPSQLKHRKYMSSNLVVLDEFGYQLMNREEANLFFRVVNYRYEKGSIAITTNKGITTWPEVLGGDEVLAGAVLDRILHSATVLNIQGRSYRLKDSETTLGSPQTATQSSATPKWPLKPAANYAPPSNSTLKSAVSVSGEVSVPRGLATRQKLLRLPSLLCRSASVRVEDSLRFIVFVFAGAQDC